MGPSLSPFLPSFCGSRYSFLICESLGTELLSQREENKLLFCLSHCYFESARVIGPYPHTLAIPASLPHSLAPLLLESPSCLRLHFHEIPNEDNWTVTRCNKKVEWVVPSVQMPSANDGSSLKVHVAFIFVSDKGAQTPAFMSTEYLSGANTDLGMDGRRMKLVRLKEVPPPRGLWEK